MPQVCRTLLWVAFLGLSGAESTREAMAGVPPDLDAAPSLGIVEIHRGDFTGGHSNTYSILVFNAEGAGPTSGTVQVFLFQPGGLTLESMKGDGWNCIIEVLNPMAEEPPAGICTRSDSLSGGASYPPIAVTLGVPGSLSAVQTAANVSGGGSASTSTTVHTIVNSSPGPISEIETFNGFESDGIALGPDGGIWFTAANFIGTITAAGATSGVAIPLSGQYPAGIAFTVTVSNVSATLAPTSGMVTVKDTALTDGQGTLTMVSASGQGWTCTFFGGSSLQSPEYTCTRDDSLAAGARYPPITVVVDISADATAAYNFATLYQADSALAMAVDSAGISTGPSLSVGTSHAANFKPGEQGATYTIMVSNDPLGAATNATVDVIETLPSDLMLVSMAGDGWGCVTSIGVCTRSDGLSPGDSFPPIVVSVNVAAGAIGRQVNIVSVSGGGSLTASATDAAVIEPRERRVR